MRFLIILLVAAGAAFFAACGDDDNKTATPTAAGSATETTAASATLFTVGGSPAGPAPFVVSVRLKDYEIVPNPDSGPAGSSEYEFQISNTGPSVHEFVVVKTDLAADDLPTDSDGAVEEGGDLEAIGEVEDIAADGQETFTASLDPGHYVLFCNIVEEGGGGTIAHYTQGMHRDFTVQ